MNKALRNKKGVTLVELLAVVVILGIIAAIAVPTIGGLIERQEANAAEATYDTIVTAAELYAEDTTAFTLAALESEDFVDLKSNEFGYMDGETLTVLTKDAIWIVVNGSTVTFYSDAGATNAIDLYINGHEGNPAE
ncbi:hypothetical protein BK011_04495 [Tenericutes bacterium MZ-XQ]|nr:hypothetical protein BK011_04495 [Tenericutes bacterium MZ-XQ]